MTCNGNCECNKPIPPEGRVIREGQQSKNDLTGKRSFDIFTWSLIIIVGQLFGIILILAYRL